MGWDGGRAAPDFPFEEYTDPVTGAKLAIVAGLVTSARPPGGMRGGGWGNSLQNKIKRGGGRPVFAPSESVHYFCGGFTVGWGGLKAHTEASDRFHYPYFSCTALFECRPAFPHHSVRTISPPKINGVLLCIQASSLANHFLTQYGVVRQASRYCKSAGGREVGGGGGTPVACARTSSSSSFYS